MLKVLLPYRIHRARNGSFDVAEKLPQILQVSWVRRNPGYRLRVSGVVLHSMPHPEPNHAMVLPFSNPQNSTLLLARIEGIVSLTLSGQHDLSPVTTKHEKSFTPTTCLQ